MTKDVRGNVFVASLFLETLRSNKAKQTRNLVFGEIRHRPTRQQSIGALNGGIRSEL